jgi:diguanylate cyclase (GGDEF)-like protein
MERALAHQALHDGLTSLPNRSLFLDRLQNALARSRRPDGRLVAVMFVDLDNFKVINDSLGHDAGNQLLMAVASRLSSLLAETDTLARFGGDEFVVLCDEMPSEQSIEDVARAIVAGMEEPFEVAGARRRITASVGVAIARPDSTSEDLMSAADTAMYRAKDSGRARHAIFDESLRDRVRARMLLDEEMRDALERQGFSLAYQPILAIDGGSLGVEALLRWERPGRGPVSPTDFIPEAERNGLIVPIGAWVLREACLSAVRWRDAGTPIRVSVNLSPRQLDDPRFVDTVVGILEETGVDPAQLQLEITESVLTQSDSAHTLKELRSLGVATVLDDFGTGYSSLSYLKLFELDSVKIDKTFIDGIGTSSGDTAIVQAVVLIARTFDIRVVAEGVEHMAQVELLRELGCDAIQGYLVAKPMPADSIDRLLRAWRPGAGPSLAGLLEDPARRQEARDTVH